VLRPARRADAPVLAHIFVQAWRSAYHGVVDDLVLDALDEAEIARRFHDFIGDTAARHNALLAVHGGEPVGFVRFGEDPDRPDAGHVFSLYVTPESMGLGVGRTLLGEVLAELAARGHRRVTLWVFEANTRARRLYERMGFEPDGGRRVEDAYGAQEIRLSRELGS
jgi:ribosomal protein S18 acetylase RimI-like enzyme